MFAAPPRSLQLFEKTIVVPITFSFGYSLKKKIHSLIEDAESAAVAYCCPESDEISLVVVPGGRKQEPKFLIYSIAKTIIAAIVLDLMEVGRVHIDSPLSDWYPQIPRASDISLRMMLQHTSGIPDYGHLPSYRNDLAANPLEPWSFDRFLAETAMQKGLFEPGSSWSYSNPTFMVLRQIAESITEMSFGELLDRLITKPLGLVSTFVANRVADLAEVAPALSTDLSISGELLDITKSYHPGWVSHGLLVSTPSEILQFYRALFGEKIITNASIEAMCQPVEVPTAPPQWIQPQYGLGLMIDPKSPFGLMYAHGGNGPGTSTFVAWLPQKKIGVCAMVSGAEAEPVVREVLLSLI